MHAALLLALAALPLQDEADRKLIEEANAIFEQGRHAEALAKYEECVKRRPEWKNALFNGGLAAYLAGKPARAADLWEPLRKLTPDDTGLLAKLIQAYQATGEGDKRDAVRKDLFDRRAKLDEAGKKKLSRYVRDQFSAGGLRVMAFEHFELAGERALRYRFSVLNEKGDAEAWYVSLGSYEITTQVAREQGTIGKDERMYHLDGYLQGGRVHKLYRMFPKEPSYDECRRLVEEVLKAGGK